MINGKYTIAEIADMLEVKSKKIWNLIGTVPDSEKQLNHNNVLTWTAPASSIPFIAEKLGIEPTTVLTNAASFSEKAGEEVSNPPQPLEETPGKTEQTISGGKPDEESTTVKELTEDGLTPWTILAILGLLIVLALTYLKK